MNHINAIQILKDAWVLVKEKLNILLSVVGVIILLNLTSTYLNSTIGRNSPLHGTIFSGASRLFLMGLSLGAIRVILDIIQNIETNIRNLFGYFHKLTPYLLASLMFGLCLFLAIIPAILFLINTFGLDVFEAVFNEEYFDISSLTQNIPFPFPDLDFGPIDGVIFLLLFIIPVGFVYLRLMFFDYFIVDQDASSLESLKLSFYITGGITGELLKLILLLAILNIIGALLMFVGLVFTIPLSMIALGLVYKVLSKNILI